MGRGRFRSADFRMNLLSCALCFVLQLLLYQDIVNGDNASKKFRILFVNDLNYGYYPLNGKDGSECRNVSDSECVGGIARLSSQLQDVMNNKKSNATDGDTSGYDTIVLNAGNFLGKNSDWFDLMKFQPAIDALRSLNFSAVSVGSEVFQYGREAASNFITNMKGVAFATNIVALDGNEPPFGGCLTTSKTFNLGGINVTVIGFLDKDGMREKDMAGLYVYKEVQAIEQFITTSKKNNGNSIFVAHGYVKTFEEVTRLGKIKGLDILIFSGGNLTEEQYNSSNYYINKIPGYTCWMVNTLPRKGNEPHHILGDLTVVTSENYATTTVSLEIHDYKNSNRSDDINILKIEADGLKRLNSIKYDSLAISKVSIGGNDSCLQEECLLGDLVTDAMLSACNNFENVSVNAAIWFPAWPFESIKIEANKPFTVNDVHKVLGSAPDQNIYTATVKLSKLVAYLENAMSLGNGKFLQLSGLWVEYNDTAQDGNKITAIRTVDSDLRLQYLDLSSDVDMTVALPANLLLYTFDLANFASAEDRSVTVATAFVDYIRRPTSGSNVIHLPIIGLRYTASPVAESSTWFCINNTSEAVLLTLTVVVLLVAVSLVVWYVVIPKIRARRGSSTPLMY